MKVKRTSTSANNGLGCLGLLKVGSLQKHHPSDNNFNIGLLQRKNVKSMNYSFRYLRSIYYVYDNTLSSLVGFTRGYIGLTFKNNLHQDDIIILCQVHLFMHA